MAYPRCTHTAGAPLRPIVHPVSPSLTSAHHVADILVALVCKNTYAFKNDVDLVSQLINCQRDKTNVLVSLDVTTMSICLPFCERLLWFPRLWRSCRNKIINQIFTSAKLKVAANMCMEAWNMLAICEMREMLNYSIYIVFSLCIRQLNTKHQKISLDMIFFFLLLFPDCWCNWRWLRHSSFNR